VNETHAGGGRLDFAAIRADNPIADTVARYIELKRRGGEYKARCPFHNDRNPSFAVVPAKDKAFCNACGWHGDVIDFVAEFEGIDTAEAARRLAGDELPTTRPKLPDLPPDEADEWQPVLPVPDDAPAYDAAKTYNPRRGRLVDWSRILTRRDEYRDADGRLLGYVVRLEIDGQKLTPAVTWARHADGRACWASVKFPEPRPLQGLDDLARRPDAPVLVVSGEKCREAGARMLPGFVTVTWPGGDNNVDKADWNPLENRASVTLWPDCDQSGREAAARIAARLSAPVRVLDVDDLEAEFGKGADLADLVAAGWTTARIIAWAKARVRPWTPPETPTPTTRPASGAGASPGSEGGGRAPAGGTAQATPPAASNPATNDAPSATAGTDPRPARRDRQKRAEVVDLPAAPNGAYESLTTWSALGLALSDKGVPIANLDNAARLLERHPEVAGHFWFDEFLQRILTTWTADGEPREWTDADDVRLALWMQRKMGIGRMAVGTARDAVTAVAMAHTRNEAREWLESLTWDGHNRLQSLIVMGFGAEANDYTEAVGRCWLVSMVARVLDPGCKVDTMPVFEGMQGRGKSTALQVLVGARWFAEASESPTSKDFFQALTGKLLVEIGEMDSFSRAEVHTIKRVISCQTDRYRAPYGRRAEDHPRQGVFAGTTNKDDWNRDETGARRFWPVACSTVDLGWIREHRAQLFAEAVARYLAGESWWDVPIEDAQREQEARRDADEWEAVIDDWLVGKWETTVGDVLLGALRLEADRWDRALQMRVARCLRVLGWRKADAWRGGKTVKVWTPPGGGKGGKDQLL
jgi:predicted P-loop ATPase